MTGHSKKIYEFIKKSPEKCTLGDIIKAFAEDGISSSSVKKNLRRLVDQGDIEYVNELGHSFLVVSFNKPVRLSESFLVCPQGLNFSVSDKDDTLIKIEKSTSFGRGDHPTTRLCLKAFDKAWSLRNLRDGFVFDLGCGTGILAAGAVLKGMAGGHAVDIDPVALFDARKNFLINSLEKKICLSKDWPEKSEFDLIFANLRPPTLKAFKKDIHGYLKSKGTLILSGFKINEQDNLLDELGAFFEPKYYWSEKGWCSVLLFKK